MALLYTLPGWRGRLDLLAPVWRMALTNYLNGRVQLPITTFRCPHCGRLESFAPATAGHP